MTLIMKFRTPPSLQWSQRKMSVLRIQTVTQHQLTTVLNFSHILMTESREPYRFLFRVSVYRKFLHMIHWPKHLRAFLFNSSLRDNHYEFFLELGYNRRKKFGFNHNHMIYFSRVDITEILFQRPKDNNKRHVSKTHEHQKRTLLLHHAIF